MEKEEFKEKFEEYLIKFTDKLIEDVNARKKYNFNDEKDKIFDFLSIGYLGNLSAEEKSKLYIENQDVAANQFYRLLSIFEIEN